MDASPIRDGRKSPDKDNITLQSLAGEWTQDYDKVVSPSAMKTSYEEPPLQQPTTGVNMYSQQRAQHDEDYYRAFQAISEPRPTDEGHRHSPTRVTFVSPQSVQRSDSPRNAQLSAENRMLETRRANASPTRFDLKFKPLPQSPAIQRSDRSSLSSPQYFEYLVPEPLNIPTKHHLPQAQQAQQAPHSPVHEASGIDSAYLDWLRTNEVSQPRDDGQRETVWFQPQPPTRYYTGDPNQPFMYVENPPVRYQKVEQGPVQASVDGMPVYRRPQNENPPHNDRELAEAVIGNHEFNRLQNNRDDRELAEAMIGNYEFKRMQTQSLNRNKHQKAASDYSEFGYRQQYSDGSNRSGQGPALVKSHSQKDYRITPPDMNEYDRVPDLEHTPGGHSRVVQQEDRSSGGSSSGPPRGRSTLRNRRSRSLSPAKKSFDVTQFMEDDEYIFCEDDEVAAAPKRSRSPMKQMFGEKGWLSRGASMNQVASQSPKKKGLKEFAKLVRQKTDDKVSPPAPTTQTKTPITNHPFQKADLSKKLGFDPSSSPYPPTTPSSPTRTSKDSAQTAHSQPSSPPEAPPPTGPSGPAVSVPPSEQMRLYGELELLLQTVANNYLHTQKELGHLSPSSVAKVSKAWHNKNRPQVLEFRFDLGTQLDLVRLNSTTLTFYGPRSADPLHKAALFNSWKGVARELGVRTFCNPDAAVKKMVHDSYKMLEMLGAKTPVFLMLQGLQQRVLRRIEEEVVLKPRRERKVRVGVTRQVDIPTAGGIGGSGGSGGNGGPGGEARMERMEKLEENSGIWCG
ncbi:hypothetical protein MMC10_000764 [Thelotrema lepadinum]|nr:hypothetical protein [Thelotrema lepadinum]